MKLLRKIPSETIEDLFFDMCLKSKSGCNVKVGDNHYNLYVNNIGEYVITEFELDYELTEEEFKKFKK
jgi:hypothetical protein